MASSIIGSIIMFMMCSILQHINNSPNDVNEFGNTIYLLIHRPLFIAGFTMIVFPVMVAQRGTPLRPFRDILGHAFWVTPARLSYGALLSHGIWMQFREFNTERGTWGSGFDAFLFFLAYLVFSYIFSFVTALLWELPVASIWKEFVVKPRLLMQSSDAFYHSQSAKSVYRDKSAGPDTEKTSSSITSVKDIINSKKRQL